MYDRVNIIRCRNIRSVNVHATIQIQCLITSNTIFYVHKLTWIRFWEHVHICKIPNKTTRLYETENSNWNWVQGFVTKALIFLVFQGEKDSISIIFHLQETCSATWVAGTELLNELASSGETTSWYAGGADAAMLSCWKARLPIKLAEKYSRMHVECGIFFKTFVVLGLSHHLIVWITLLNKETWALSAKTWVGKSTAWLRRNWARNKLSCLSLPGPKQLSEYPSLSRKTCTCISIAYLTHFIAPFWVETNSFFKLEPIKWALVNLVIRSHELTRPKFAAVRVHPAGSPLNSEANWISENFIVNNTVFLELLVDSDRCCLGFQLGKV